MSNYARALNGNALLAEYANLSSLHDALGVLVGLKVITRDEQIAYTRKFMQDRPEFKKAVEAAMNAGLHK
jgi:hypothetical protein